MATFAKMEQEGKDLKKRMQAYKKEKAHGPRVASAARQTYILGKLIQARANKLQPGTFRTFDKVQGRDGKTYNLSGDTKRKADHYSSHFNLHTAPPGRQYDTVISDLTTYIAWARSGKALER